MARTPKKASNLSIKKNRLGLPQSKKPVYESLGDGVCVGYRRNLGTGTWVARKADGRGGSHQHVIGQADDFEEANGATILSWAQAQAAAFEWSRRDKTVEVLAPVTLAKVLEHYEADITTRNGDTGNVTRLRHHLSESLLAKAVTALTVGDLKAWRDGLAKTLAPATVNRTTTPLKAALNQAADADQGRTILSRAPWEIGLATLMDAEEARNVILPDAEVAKVVAAAYADSAEFGLLVEVAAVTGSRYSQLCGLTVADLQDGHHPEVIRAKKEGRGYEARLMIPSAKKGKGQKKVLRRPVPIPAALAANLRKAAEGRAESAPLLVRPTGDAWKHSDQARPFKRARKAAGLAVEALAPYTIDDVTIYSLRHSSIVRQALRGVPLRVVAALHDTSVAMIERTYSARIGDHADAIARAALLDLSAPVVLPPPPPPPLRREPMAGACRHGHSYVEFPPYLNSTGSVVCAECARARTRRVKAAKRADRSASGEVV